jgi:hypothetical protein
MLCHKNVWGNGCIAPPFTISALDGGEWSTSHPSRLHPRVPIVRRLGGLQGRSGRCGPTPAPFWNRTLAWTPIARHYTGWTIINYPLHNFVHFSITSSLLRSHILGNLFSDIFEFCCAIKMDIKFDYNGSKQLYYVTFYDIFYLPTYGDEPYLRSCQLCSHSGNSQQF